MHKVIHSLIKQIIQIKDIKIETMEVIIIRIAIREMRTILIEEEEVEVEALMVVVIDSMGKEINTKVTEANNQDMNHKENYHKLNLLKC